MKLCQCTTNRAEWLSPEILLGTIPDGVMVVDAEGRVCAWNRAMQRLTGYAADDVCGKPCTFLECDACGVHAGESVENCGLLRGEADQLTIECEVRKSDGEQVPVLKSVGVVRDDAGKVVGLVETFSDMRKVKRLERELVVLGGSEFEPGGVQGLIGRSDAMRAVYERIHLAAESEATVLLLGETGTGKERVGEAIHRESARRDGPLVKVNCSALSETLLESELFGHVKGAFTGATQDKPGRFEMAGCGMIFLDEIGDLTPLIQLKLLRVLQERTFERVGDSTPRTVDIRVVCATHRDLHKLVRQGLFREDLYYRIRVFPITIPPLRERKCDIPLLLDHFIKLFNASTGRDIQGVEEEAMRCLMDHCWPWNVRELENAVEHAFVTCRNGRISLFDLPMEIRMIELRNAHCLERGYANESERVPSRAQPALTQMDDPDAFLKLLRECNGNKSEAARRLGVNRTTIWRRMKNLGVQYSVSPGRSIEPARQ
ncbi:MAG: sigma 54-interacting transcriptional regulator [Candidatus Pacebacteria bacterium]|nr:sigma 54-interacting transcriptional regulator [Candidatus Paceibacterota bacterium]